MKDFELSINPVETYKAPEIPVLGEDFFTDIKSHHTPIGIMA